MKTLNSIATTTGSAIKTAVKTVKRYAKNTVHVVLNDRFTQFMILLLAIGIAAIVLNPSNIVN